MEFDKIKAVLQETFDEWKEDHIQREAGALAFFTIFSLAPTLVIAIAVGSLVVSRSQLRSQVLDWVSQTINPNAATVVEDMLRSAANTGGGVATIVSVLFLLVAGTTLFHHLRNVMNKIWDVEKEDRGIQERLRNRLVALFFVVLLGVLLVIIVGLNSILPAVIGTNYAQVGWAQPVARLVSAAITFAIFAMVFAGAFKWLPEAEVEWDDVAVGAMLTALLFMIGQFFVQLYIQNSSAASAYGAAGTLVAILVWIFYTMFVLLTGAEFTRVYSRKYGSQRESNQPPRSAERVQASA